MTSAWACCDFEILELVPDSGRLRSLSSLDHDGMRRYVLRNGAALRVMNGTSTRCGGIEQWANIDRLVENRLAVL